MPLPPWEQKAAPRGRGEGLLPGCPRQGWALSPRCPGALRWSRTGRGQLSSCARWESRPDRDLALFLGKPWKGQALVEQLPLVVRGEGEREDSVSAERHLPPPASTPPGRGCRRAAGAALPARLCRLPPLLAPPKDPRPSPRGAESAPVKSDFFFGKGPWGAEPGSSCLRSVPTAAGT